jgi:hypothetical protein
MEILNLTWAELGLKVRVMNRFGLKSSRVERIRVVTHNASFNHELVNKKC